MGIQAREATPSCGASAGTLPGGLGRRGDERVTCAVGRWRLAGRAFAEGEGGGRLCTGEKTVLAIGVIGRGGLHAVDGLQTESGELGIVLDGRQDEESRVIGWVVCKEGLGLDVQIEQPLGRYWGVRSVSGSPQKEEKEGGRTKVRGDVQARVYPDEGSTRGARGDKISWKRRV